VGKRIEAFPLYRNSLAFEVVPNQLLIVKWHLSSRVRLRSIGIIFADMMRYRAERRFRRKRGEVGLHPDKLGRCLESSQLHDPAARGHRRRRVVTSRGVTILSSDMPPNESMIRLLNPLPAAVNTLVGLPTPTINSSAAVVVAEPPFAVVPVPVAVAVTSEGTRRAQIAVFHHIQIGPPLTIDLSPQAMGAGAAWFHHCPRSEDGPGCGPGTFSQSTAHSHARGVRRISGRRQEIVSYRHAPH